MNYDSSKSSRVKGHSANRKPIDDFISDLRIQRHIGQHCTCWISLKAIFTQKQLCMLIRLSVWRKYIFQTSTKNRWPRLRGLNFELTQCGARVPGARGVHHFGASSPLLPLFPDIPFSTLSSEVGAFEVGPLSPASGSGSAITQQC